jgi:hypothetical protein
MKNEAKRQHLLTLCNALWRMVESKAQAGGCFPAPAAGRTGAFCTSLAVRVVCAQLAALPGASSPAARQKTIASAGRAGSKSLLAHAPHATRPSAGPGSGQKEIRLMTVNFNLSRY